MKAEHTLPGEDTYLVMHGRCTSRLRRSHCSSYPTTFSNQWQLLLQPHFPSLAQGPPKCLPPNAHTRRMGRKWPPAIGRAEAGKNVPAGRKVQSIGVVAELP